MYSVSRASFRDTRCICQPTLLRFLNPCSLARERESAAEQVIYLMHTRTQRDEAQARAHTRVWQNGGITGALPPPPLLLPRVGPIWIWDENGGERERERRLGNWRRSCVRNCRWNWINEVVLLLGKMAMLFVCALCEWLCKDVGGFDDSTRLMKFLCIWC